MIPSQKRTHSGDNEEHADVPARSVHSRQPDVAAQTEAEHDLETAAEQDTEHALPNIVTGHTVHQAQHPVIKLPQANRSAPPPQPEDPSNAVPAPHPVSHSALELPTVPEHDPTTLQTQPPAGGPGAVQQPGSSQQSTIPMQPAPAGTQPQDTVEPAQQLPRPEQERPPLSVYTVITSFTDERQNLETNCYGVFLTFSAAERAIEMALQTQKLQARSATLRWRTGWPPLPFQSGSRSLLENEDSQERDRIYAFVWESPLYGADGEEFKMFRES